MEPVWLPVPGFPDYWVSSDGQVSRRGGPKLGCLRQGIHEKGYRYVLLRKDRDRTKTKLYVHRLVCEVFHGSPPPGAHHAHHINELRDDNRWDNLSWVSCGNQHHPDPAGTDKYPQEEDDE